MNIALVMPRSTFLELPMVFQPLGLFYLAARLESLGHMTDFYDLNVDEFPADSYDQIWVSATSPQMKEIKRVLRVAKHYETALGPVGQGDGMVGLVSAFEQAGARSVVATHWSIDESAAEVMAPFYKSVAAGQGLADALRGAKLDVVKKRIRLGGTEVSLAHPFFWAPFVLIGADK